MANKIRIKEKELERIWRWTEMLSVTIKELQRIRTEVYRKVEQLKLDIERLKKTKDEE